MRAQNIFFNIYVLIKKKEEYSTAITKVACTNSEILGHTFDWSIEITYSDRNNWSYAFKWDA